MSVMGTGIAAAVASTHQTAREQKKVERKRQREEEDRSHAVREAYEVHLLALEDGEGTGARLHADGQLDDEHDPARRLELIRQYRDAIHAAAQVEANTDHPRSDDEADTPPAEPVPPRPLDPPEAPPRHLDVEA